MKKHKKLFLSVLSLVLLSGVFGGIAHATTVNRMLDFGRPANANPWGIASMSQTGSLHMRTRVAQGDNLAAQGTSWATTTGGKSVTSARFTATQKHFPIVGQYQTRANANATWHWHPSITR